MKVGWLFISAGKIGSLSRVNQIFSCNNLLRQ